MCCTISQSFALTPSGVRLFNLEKIVWPARPRVGGIPRVHGNFSLKNNFCFAANSQRLRAIFSLIRP